MKNKKSSLFQIIGIALMFFAFYGLSKLQRADGLLIPMSVFALLTGVILEGKRLMGKWATVFYTALASFAFSFLCFLPGKREHPYVFDNHVALWPYYFLVIFALISLITSKDKVTPRLTEGITWLQSMALIYLLIDERFFEQQNAFVYFLIGLIILFSLISMFNAFTYFKLSRTNRLLLSIWSSLIMLVFAIDNIYKTFQNRAIEIVPSLQERMLILVEFFLLGISSMYILQNFFMLIGFLPGRGTFFNQEYFRGVRKIKDDHIDRYSEQQVKIFHSFICLTLTGSAFYLNYKFGFLSRNMAIWLSFFIIPLLFDVLETIEQSVSKRIYR